MVGDEVLALAGLYSFVLVGGYYRRDIHSDHYLPVSSCRRMWVD